MDKIAKFNKKTANKTFPAIKSGDTVKVYQTIKEGEKERIQIFEGTVIKVHGGYGQNGSFTVRKITSGVGVEKIMPFMLPSISKIELVKRGIVRRSRLYYLREKQQKESRLKEKVMTGEDKIKASFDANDEKEEEKKQEKKPESKNSEPEKLKIEKEENAEKAKKSEKKVEEKEKKEDKK